MKCPVCTNETHFAGNVDFNRSCEDRHAQVFPPSGKDITYRQCWTCRVLFAPEMLAWPVDRYLAEVYNEDYERVDPDYLTTRPDVNAASIDTVFGRFKPSHLDYGGGNGRLSAYLRDHGWQSQSYDPLAGDALPEAQFDLITAYEVIEHVPDPTVLMNNLLQLTHRQSMVLFSTATHDDVPDPLNWWYVAPRNGHVMIHSKTSLARMFNRAGFHTIAFNQFSHGAYREIPPWFEQAVQDQNRGHH